MIVGHSFTGGRESFYALTETGKKLATVLDRMTVPSPVESASHSSLIGRSVSGAAFSAAT